MGPEGPWQSVVKVWQCILLQVCFMTFWACLSCQAPHRTARSSKCDYELGEKVLLFVCSKHCLITSLIAVFSCIMKSSDWLLPHPLPRVVSHLAGLSCSLSVLFIFFKLKSPNTCIFMQMISYPRSCLSNSNATLLRQAVSPPAASRDGHKMSPWRGMTQAPISFHLLQGACSFSFNSYLANGKQSINAFNNWGKQELCSVLKLPETFILIHFCLSKCTARATN